MSTKLLQGESLVQPPVRQHWFLLLKELRWPTIALLVVLVIVVVLPIGLTGDARALLALLCLVLYAGAIWAARETWRASSMTITDQRVIVQSGVFRKTVQVIPLDRVQDLSTTQSLIGQWLDFGSIEIDTAGAIPNKQFHYANHPELLRDQMFMLSEALRRGL